MRKRLFLRAATRGCTQQESTADLGKHGKILQEKEGVRYGKGGFRLQKQWFGSTKVKVWQHESNGLTLRNINKSHPRRSLRASAPVDTSICVGRYEHLRRSIRASASVDTSICVGRYEHPRRSMRMTKVGSMKRKRDGVNEGKEEREAEEGEVQAWGKRGQTWGKRGAWVWQGCHTLLR